MIDTTKIKPELLGKIKLFLDKCKAANIDVLIYSGFRSSEEQYVLWMQGRFDLSIVNKARLKVGLYPISEFTNKRIVTQVKSGHSKHEIGEAFDCVVLLNGIPDWGITARSLWTTMGNIGKDVGLVWGKNFVIRDYVHFELPSSKRRI